MSACACVRARICVYCDYVSRSVAVRLWYTATAKALAACMHCSAFANVYVFVCNYMDCLQQPSNCIEVGCRSTTVAEH